MKKKIRQSWNVARYETKLTVLSSKFVLLSVLSFIVMSFSADPVRRFAAEYGVALSPGILPFYLADARYGNIMFFFLILLFSDMPMKQKGQNQVLQRCGLGCFGMGQLLSMVAVSLVFVVEQILFSILVCIPDLTFRGWGKVWGSIVDNVFYEAGYTVSFAVPAAVLRDYTLPEALLQSALTFFLTGVCYGLFIFLLNGVCKNRVGVSVMAVWSVCWIFLRVWPGKVTEKVMRFSPQSLNDLSLHGKGYGSVAVILLLAVIMVLTIVDYVLIKKRKLSLVK